MSSNDIKIKNLFDVIHSYWYNPPFKSSTFIDLIS